MDRYGSDKPDLRFGLPIVDVTDMGARVRVHGLSQSAAQAGGGARHLCAQAGPGCTRSDIDELTQKALSLGRKGHGVDRPAPGRERQLDSDQIHRRGRHDATCLTRVGAKAGDFILFCADAVAAVRRVLGVAAPGAGRTVWRCGVQGCTATFVCHRLSACLNIPQEEGRFVATHHPFTMPDPEDLPYLAVRPRAGAGPGL